MPKPDEMILVVPRALFDRLGAFQGLCFEPDRYMQELLSRSNNRFTARSLAEEDPSWKQIIPYAIFTHGDRVLHYTRGGKGGESRLHRKGSIGIGGHMNDQDEGLFALDTEAYLAGVQREIREELCIEGGFTQRVVALLNDDSNDVGRVHLGVVHVVSLEQASVTSNEPSIDRPEFLDREQLLARRDSLETWSQFCLDGLDRLLEAPSTPSAA